MSSTRLPPEHASGREIPAYDPSFLIGTVLNHTYRVGALISHGALGAVYRAHHLRLPRSVTVKVLPPGETDPGRVHRFEREARVTCAVRHPNVVDVLDLGRMAHGVPFIVMELLEGESLRARLDRAVSLPVPEIVAIVRQAGSALQTAHEAGVVHHDLKPENLFLCRLRGLDDIVKVMGFGVSGSGGSRQMPAQLHAVVGTPCYLSPEQAAGRSSEADARTDIFSFGLIVHEMLTGQPAFVGTLHQVVHERPAAPSALRTSLPVAVDEVLAWVLRKSPADRPASASLLVDALVDALLFCADEVPPRRRPELRRRQVAPEGDSGRAADPARAGGARAGGREAAQRKRPPLTGPGERLRPPRDTGPWLLLVLAAAIALAGSCVAAIIWGG